MEEYWYKECGLDNVLIEGLQIEIDDDGDEIITIPEINKLHQVIAEGIVCHPGGMSGKELRFLRTEMGLTQAELAKLVHRDRQAVMRWEKGRPIGSAEEALVRLMAIQLLKLDVAGNAAEVSERCVPTADVQQITVLKEGNTYRRLAA
jgi:DNA-binding XRE family transcriptional regulator